MVRHKARFVVVDEAGRQSTLWRFFTSGSDESVYLAPRAHMRHGHFSVHESGHCHYVLKSKSAVTLAAAAGKPVVAGTVRLAEWVPHTDWMPGWRRALSVIVPVSELRLPAKDAEPGVEVRVIHPVAGAAVVNIALLIGPPQAQAEDVPRGAMPTEPVAAFWSSTRSAWLVAYHDPIISDWVAEEIDRTRKDMKPGYGAFRLARMGSDGCGFVLDMGPPTV